jgi:cell division protein FtsB
MTLIEFDLTVIAVCSVLITVFLVALLLVLYRLLKKVEVSVDTVNNQLKPAIMQLKENLTALSSSLQTVNSLFSFTRRFKREKKD